MTPRHYPEKLEIVPLTKPPNATILVPGSKSITNRALILAALSEPGMGSILHNIADCDDSRIMVEALSDLGFKCDVKWDAHSALIWRESSHSRIPVQSATLLLGNSGTCMRFLTAMVSIGEGRYELDGVARMRERPMGDLLDALKQIGVHAGSLKGDGYPPILIESGSSVFKSASVKQKTVRMNAEISSQFLSGLLMAAPFAMTPFRIELSSPLVSEPYVRMTVALMHSFGANVKTNFETRFEVWPIPWYQSHTVEIEPDATAAGYHFAAAAILGGRTNVPGFGVDSLQGDIGFLNVLDEMGCKSVRTPDTLELNGRPLKGIDADMNAISDCAPTLAAVACFADGPTTIRNVAHIRHKESDRISAMATELRKVGAEVDEFPDGLRIMPRPLHGAEIDTYNDHRIAMSMALIGLKVPGIGIKNPGCVAKTYPGFWDDLEKLRQ